MRGLAVTLFGSMVQIFNWVSSDVTLTNTAKYLESPENDIQMIDCPSTMRGCLSRR